MKKLLDLKIDSPKQTAGIQLEQTSSRDIAIIGIALRLPKANNLEEYWSNIANKVDCITGIPSTRVKDVEEFLNYKGIKADKYFEKGYLEEIDKFDYSFFGLSPKEASLIDPNQRLFLEIAWEAIEDSGYGGDKLKSSRTGVYLGFGSELLYKRFIDEIEPASAAVALPGNLAPIIASRISYLLDLTGPSLSIDTACSSALVAFHYACQGIRNGECNMAIAGTVSMSLIPVDVGQRIGIESSDGRARAFDDSSDGTSNGEGVAALVLKPLNKAIDDGDNIYAVIKGSAINQDGSSMGITAPNPAAQEDILVRAWKNAGIEPETISYIETHGTGTKLGDPIEIDGIQRAFRRYTSKKAFCAIGSVKTNIGHLDSAAGIAGILKAVAALKEKKLPPNIHFRRPNRQIAFEESPVYVNDRLAEWETGDIPRRCGVSSFGISGTNCHVILEEAPEIRAEGKPAAMTHVLALSAKSEAALKELIDAYKKLFVGLNWSELPDICYTANTGRGHYSHRMALLFGEGVNPLEVIESVDSCHFEKCCSNTVFYGKHTIVGKNRQEKTEFEITRDELEQMGKEVACKLGEYISHGCSETTLLRELLQLYVKGADIAWNELYKQGRHRTVKVPVYPFERKRCWLDIPESNIENKVCASQKMFYHTVWKEKYYDESSPAKKPNTTIVLKGVNEASDRITAKLKGKGIEIIEVEKGNSFEKVDETRYIVSGSEEDFERLFTGLKVMGFTRIVNLMSLKAEKISQSLQMLDENLKQGVNILFNLAKAIKSCNLRDELDLVLIGEYACEVTGNETFVIPENSALFALGKVVGNEINNVKCRCLDIDAETDEERIFAELENFSCEVRVAFRQGKRYIEEIQNVDLLNLDKAEVKMTEGGVYLITGGLGGLGLEMAKYLAAKSKQLKLVLIGRSDMPERTEWASVLQNNSNKKLCDRINAIKEIEKAGSEVICYTADVADKNKLEGILKDLRSKFGAINGIIHCAGVAGQGFIINKDENIFNNVLAAKIQGTWLLDHLTYEDKLDFFIMFSSFVSVIGEPGQGDYAAANAYMDSYQAFRSKQGKRTLTINWTSWKETGMSVDFGVNVDGIFKTMPTQQAVAAFEMVLNRNISRVIIGEINFENEIFQAIDIPLNISEEIKNDIQKIKMKTDPNSIEEMPCVDLRGRKKEEDYTDMEKQLGQLWGKVLGLKEINIYDDFFDIGGHSLLAAKLEAEMEKRGMLTDGMDVYKYRSIREMAVLHEGGSNHTANMSPEIKEAGTNTIVQITCSDGSIRHGLKLLDDIQPFNDVYYISCFYNSFFPVLHHFKRSAIPFQINDVIKYNYNFKDNNAGAEYFQVKSFEGILGNIGMEVGAKRQSYDIIGDIKTSISAGRPVIIWVDCYYESIREDTYQKNHLSHTWLVFGYDDENQTCYIIDHNRSDNLTYEKRIVSYWDVVNSYHGYIVNFQSESTGASYFEFYPAIQPKDVLLGEEYIPLFMKNAFAYKEVIKAGLDSLEEFINEIGTIVMDEGLLKLHAESIFNMLNSVINAKQVEKYRTSQLFGEHSEIAKLTSEIAASWNNARKPIGRYVFSGIYNQGYIQSVVACFKNIYAHENRLCKEFYFSKYFSI